MTAYTEKSDAAGKSVKMEVIPTILRFQRIQLRQYACLDKRIRYFLQGRSFCQYMKGDVLKNTWYKIQTWYDRGEQKTGLGGEKILE